jgi:carbonic anhydrase
LKEGNRRFLEGQPLRRDLNSQRQATAGGQYPFAVVLGCMDSRCAPEQVFDQGIGDLFSVRLAGNVVNGDVLGSLEFACRVAGAKLIVVLGHSQCGAIKGAASQVQLGHLTALLQRIQPSVAAATPGAPGTTPAPSLLEAITENHVRRMVGQIADQSPVLMDLQHAGKLKIVGGIYSLETGMVRFLE